MSGLRFLLKMATPRWVREALARGVVFPSLISHSPAAYARGVTRGALARGREVGARVMSTRSSAVDYLMYHPEYRDIIDKKMPLQKLRDVVSEVANGLDDKGSYTGLRGVYLERGRSPLNSAFDLQHEVDEVRARVLSGGRPLLNKPVYYRGRSSAHASPEVLIRESNEALRAGVRTGGYPTLREGGPSILHARENDPLFIRTLEEFPELGSRVIPLDRKTRHRVDSIVKRLQPSPMVPPSSTPPVTQDVTGWGEL